MLISMGPRLLSLATRNLFIVLTTTFPWHPPLLHMNEIPSKALDTISVVGAKNSTMTIKGLTAEVA